MFLAINFIFYIILTNLFLISAKGLNLTVIHNNDIHSRILPANKLGEDCESSLDPNCFGGIPRIIYKVNKLRQQIPNLLYLNAGDNFFGTLWYSVYKWKIWAFIIKYMQFNAMSFGNHEFDDGVEGIAEYVQKISNYTPTLACNLDLSKEPRLSSLVKKSIVLTVDGTKIGLIGYVIPETAFISRPGPTIKFLDEIKCIRHEAELLKRRGINVIIALGHSGFEVDKEIARQVPDVDIVVGGHTNTFLYNGKQPSSEKPEDVYPVVIKHKDGRKSLVVQAFAYGKYLGFLNVTFDEKGNIKQFSGKPILLDNKVPEDQRIRRWLLPAAQMIKKKFNALVGYTSVFLDNDCRRQECNLGNMVTDAMIYYALNEQIKSNKSMESIGWSEYPIAILSSGAIKMSIDNKNGGKILARDAMRVHPYENTIVDVTITGKDLWEAFETSVSRYEDKDTGGEFLQVSGAHVVYDVSKPIGKRVVSVELRCGKCRVPKLEPLDERKTYTILANNFIAEGGDNYSMLKKSEQKNLGKLISDAIMDYIKRFSPITSRLEHRSEFISRSFPNLGNNKH